MYIILFSGKILKIMAHDSVPPQPDRVSSSGGDRGEASLPNPLASPPKNLTFNLIKQHDITQSLKITPLFHRILTEISHKLSENTSQGTWHATYAPSFIALPPQIFVAR
jgi:hypothetical protein